MYRYYVLPNYRHGQVDGFQVYRHANTFDGSLAVGPLHDSERTALAWASRNGLHVIDLSPCFSGSDD